MGFVGNMKCGYSQLIPKDSMKEKTVFQLGSIQFLLL